MMNTNIAERQLAIWTLCFMVVAVCTVEGVNRDWDLDSDGDWNVATNWTGDILPGVGDTARLGVPGLSSPFTIDLKGGLQKVGELRVQNSQSYTLKDTDMDAAVDLELVGGGTFFTLVIDSGSSLTLDNVEVLVTKGATNGFLIRGDSSFNVTNGSSFSGTANSIQIGDNSTPGAPSVMTVDGKGSTVDIPKGIEVGRDDGSGQLLVTGGGEVEVAFLNILPRLSSNDSLVKVSGSDNDGTVSRLEAGFLSIGANLGAPPAIDPVDTGTLLVGDGAAGEVEVATNVIMGIAENRKAEINVRGNGANMSIRFFLTVGEEAESSVSISEGGSMYIGATPVFTPNQLTNEGLLRGGDVGGLGGTVTVAKVLNKNLVQAGRPGTRSTLSIIGDYEQTSSGRSEFEIDSLASFDDLYVDGTVDLDGTIKVFFDGAYVPIIGDGFDLIVSTGGITTDLNTLGLTLDGTLAQTSLEWMLVLTDGGNNLRLVLVPEPGVYAALGVFLSLAACESKRRRRLS